MRIRLSDLAFIWIKCSNFICITFSSTTDHTFRLRLLHIRHSDFASIWIRCSDFICITFSSAADQTFRLRLLHIRCSDFVFCISGVQTSPLYGSDVQTSSVSYFLAPQSDFQTSSSAYQAFKLRLHMDQMFRLHLYHIC